MSESFPRRELASRLAQAFRGKETTRDLERFTVADTQTHDNGLTVVISTDGCVFHRPAADFTRLPIPGENLHLESIGCRVTGLYDPAAGTWLFRWTDQELAEQDSAVPE